MEAYATLQEFAMLSTRGPPVSSFGLVFAYLNLDFSFSGHIPLSRVMTCWLTW